MKIAVAICTTGRPGVVADCVRLLARQTRRPDSILVCGAAPGDVAEAAAVEGVQCVVSPRKGLTIQRNLALDTIGNSADVILFMDDDFLLHDTYIERMEARMTADPSLVVITGHVVFDGIHNATGYTFAEAEKLLAGTPLTPEAGLVNVAIQGAYGCNFAIRQNVAREHNIRFDERLPLYGWQEDIDFTAQLARFGRMIRTDALLGVHLGVKGGRQSGVRLGYSQIANVVYLINKGTMDGRYGLKLMTRNLAANIAGSLGDDRHVDRRGRFRGNMLALKDIVLRRRVTPERILEL